jgi:hypothetical protein
MLSINNGDNGDGSDRYGDKLNESEYDNKNIDTQPMEIYDKNDHKNYDNDNGDNDDDDNDNKNNDDDDNYNDDNYNEHYTATITTTKKLLPLGSYIGRPPVSSR